MNISFYSTCNPLDKTHNKCIFVPILTLLRPTMSEFVYVFVPPLTLSIRPTMSEFVYVFYSTPNPVDKTHNE